jgi:hypothetical protein
MMRTDVKPDSPWTQRMAEINIVESWAWWLVTQVGVTPATAKDYMHTANAWHERFVGYGLGAGLPLTRVSKMLDGLARLQGVPPPKRFRIGVRPKHLRQAIDAGLDTRDSLNANYATAFEVCLVAIARAGEIASGLPHGTFDVTRHPSRADLTFQFDNTGSPISATIMIVNSKARGIEARRKLPVVLPMRGEYLAPATCSGRSIALQIQFPARHATLRRSSATRLPTKFLPSMACAHHFAPSCPTLDETEALMERIHFASAALQLWPFAKLAPKSSKTSDDGTATHIFATSASVAESTCHT